MINIDPYIQRLEWLKEWMAYKIDRRMRVNTQLNTFDLTGMLPWGKLSFFDYKDFSTFDQYCKYKQSL